MLLLLLACTPATIKLDDSASTGHDPNNTGTTDDSGGGTTVLDDSGNTTTGPDDSGSTHTDPLTLTGLNPALGPTTGGTAVILTGTGFAQGINVQFGTGHATITSLSDTELAVTTPPGSAGVVDVSVSLGADTQTLTQAYTYVSPINYGSYTGNFEQITYLNYNEGTDAWSTLYRLDPEADVPWWMFYSSALDSCESDYSYAPNTYNQRSDAVTVHGGSDVSLSWDNGAWNNWNLGRTWVASTAYTVDFPAISSDPALLLSPAFQTPAELDLQSPDLSNGDLPTLGVNDLRFQWAAGAATDVVAIKVESYNWDNRLQETVSCAVKDDGSFNIPTTTWQDWQNEGYISIYISRIRDIGTTMPDGSPFHLSGVYTLQGYAYAQ